MRGKLGEAGRREGRVGLIPAHAGKTTPPPEAREPLWAHPRSCGENILRAIPAITAAGSSPLMRGKPWSARR